MTGMIKCVLDIFNSIQILLSPILNCVTAQCCCHIWMPCTIHFLILLILKSKWKLCSLHFYQTIFIVLKQFIFRYSFAQIVVPPLFEFDHNFTWTILGSYFQRAKIAYMFIRHFEARNDPVSEKWWMNLKESMIVNNEMKIINEYGINKHYYVGVSRK